MILNNIYRVIDNYLVLSYVFLPHRSFLARLCTKSFSPSPCDSFFKSSFLIQPLQGKPGWFPLHSPATRDRIRAVAAGEDDYEEKIRGKVAVEM